MASYRTDASVTLHTFRNLQESHMATEETHSRFNDDDEDSSSSRDTDMDRSSNSSALSTLDELQEQLPVNDNPCSVVTGRTDDPQMNEAESSDLDSSPIPIRSFKDDLLPDLLRDGRPLRRRVSSPVSATLKHVKREVELSRQRSLRLKAQVDKLQQQNESGPGWSENRTRVTEEVQSVVKLLLPLTDLKQADIDQPSQDNSLDIALRQLQKVSRKLALDHTYQGKENLKGQESEILQQALRDRDDAVEKKHAMETELLKSKNELMMLNNQLLEAVQSRLEMSIELEAWKDDVQTILNHQLMKQQQEEQAQKKSRGFLRRSNKPLPPKPDYSTLTHSPLTISPSPSPSPSPAGTMKWKEKFRRGKISLQGPAEPQPQRMNREKEQNFQTISLD